MSIFKYAAFYDLEHTILDGNSATHDVHEDRKQEVMTEGQFRHAVWISILYKMNIG